MTTNLTTGEKRLALLQRAHLNQDRLNARLSETWHLQGWKYYRAAWTELGEAVGHYHWLWWKSGTFGQTLSAPERMQVWMELVDAFHFLMSMQLVDARARANGDEKLFDSQILGSAAHYADCFNSVKGFAINDESAIADLELSVGFLIRYQRVPHRHFVEACAHAGLTLDMFLALYIAKATLNRFRWNNGYNLPKDDPGAYIKMWGMDGKKVEDNEVLAYLMLGMTDGVASLVETLYTGTFSDSLYERLMRWYEGMPR